MELFVGVLLGLFGVVLIVAGALGRGPELFATVTGSGTRATGAKLLNRAGTATSGGGGSF